jgi:hypothetical protein
MRPIVALASKTPEFSLDDADFASRGSGLPMDKPKK